MLLRKMLAAATIALGLAAGAANASVILDNGPPSDTIQPFGPDGSPTYGEVFTAPISGTLTSFTLWLNGGVGELFGGVGNWNGTSSFNFGFGSPNNLYQSSDVASPGAGPYTFSPNITVVAGQQYVAYISTFGVANASGSTTMPLSFNPVSGIDYFVWNNFGDPRNNASWDYFFDGGNAQFSATFVPEPESLALVALAIFSLIGFGAARRRVTA